MRAQELKIADFTYHLPDEKIAHHPLSKRDESKLLVYKNGLISETIFKNLHEQLQAGDTLIFNDTKVVHARMVFVKDSGARIEIMCLEPFEPNDAALCFKQTKTCKWVALIGNNKKWKDGFLTKNLTINGRKVILQANKIKQHLDSFIVEFTWNNDFSFADIIYHAGLLPLPPYMNRDAENEDEERYQTVYAKFEGSVAAPTAGLHFTQDVFDTLIQQKINISYVTLHVGAGTFKPVKAEKMSDHQMHEEHIVINIDLITQIHQSIATNRRIIAVGTTSLRTIESLFWFGLHLLNHKQNWHNINSIQISQWQPYENNAIDYSKEDIIKAILDWMAFKNINVLQGATQIIIAPPYQIKLVDAIITNFHQPESTLLLLVSAFIGNDWRKVYDYALTHNFRFLSYGDSSILFKN